MQAKIYLSIYLGDTSDAILLPQHFETCVELTVSVDEDSDDLMLMYGSNTGEKFKVYSI